MAGGWGLGAGAGRESGGLIIIIFFGHVILLFYVIT